MDFVAIADHDISLTQGSQFKTNEATSPSKQPMRFFDFCVDAKSCHFHFSQSLQQRRRNQRRAFHATLANSTAPCDDRPARPCARSNAD
jgi:hypothetical protein